MKKSIKKNYFYNLFFQIFKIIVPILVTPYIARTLSEDGSGQYTFAYSIVTYFVLLAGLGFENYAQRLIASHQNDKHSQSIDFWEIIIARLIPSFFSLVLYIVLININLFDTKYSVLLFILIFEIVAIIFDVNFYFQGNEEFGKIVSVNALIRIVSYICIFIFVKKQSDLWIYTLIQSASILISNLLLWMFLKGRIERVSFKELNILKHLPSTLVLFLPTIAVSVYTTLDKTLIGLITNIDSENGNYSYAEKLVKMSMTFVTSLGTVMIPRNSKQFADNDIEGIENNINNSIRFVFFLGIPLMLGLIAISDNLIPWFLGEGYDKAALLLKTLSPLVLLIGLSNVFGKQYLVPSHSDKKYAIAIISGAFVNLILNLFLIRLLLSEGAAIATIVAESFITLIMFIFVAKKISITKSFIKSWKYICAGIIMFVPCLLLGKILESSILNSLIIALTGSCIYFVILLLLKDEYIFKIFDLLKLFFRKK